MNLELFAYIDDDKLTARYINMAHIVGFVDDGKTFTIIDSNGVNVKFNHPEMVASVRKKFNLTYPPVMRE